jgi:(1->4)-alpha-D-glucan 1-alpha-D-glucosylmutase
VPDFYQGTELWDFSLVDPDNRRPVDYARRRTLLCELDLAAEEEGRAALAARLITTRDDRIKLYATVTLLRFRQAYRGVLDDGDYRPLAAHGQAAEHLFAFARTRGETAVLVIVPRLLATLASDPEVVPLGERTWTDTTVDLTGLPAARAYRNPLTGSCLAARPGAGLRAAELFEHFPVAMLAADPL